MTRGRMEQPVERAGSLIRRTRGGLGPVAVFEVVDRIARRLVPR